MIELVNLNFKRPLKDELENIKSEIDEINLNFIQIPSTRTPKNI